MILNLAESSITTTPARDLRTQQLEVVCSAARQEILDLLASHGGLSVAELATLTGRQPTSLYYHLSLLARVELIESTGDEAGPGATYRLLGQADRFRSDPGSESQRQAMSAAAGSLLRLTEREARQALEGGEAEKNGPFRTCRVSRQKVWLSEADLREVNRHLDALSAFLRSPRQPGLGTLCSLTYVLAPTPSPEVSDG